MLARKLVDMAVQGLDLLWWNVPLYLRLTKGPDRLHPDDVHLAMDILAVAMFYGLVVH